MHPHDTYSWHAGCTVHKNPYRAMMEEEATAQVDASAPENTEKGKWFSNPKPEALKAIAQQLEQRGNGGVPMIDVGSQLPPKARDEKSKKKRKEPEADGFDAW